MTTTDATAQLAMLRELLERIQNRKMNRGHAQPKAVSVPHRQAVKSNPPSRPEVPITFADLVRRSLALRPR